MLTTFSDWPLWAVLCVFLAAAAVIATVGVQLTRLADRLADVTGLGEAIFGAVFLGASTSLPGIVTSVTTAFEGYPQLSVSNAVGGIAVQTVFLVIADMAYPRANLEHAAASVENLIQAALLTTLLAIPIFAMAGPDIHLFGIHPGSVLLIAGYLFGIQLASRTRSEVPWKARHTAETRVDDADDPAAVPLSRYLVFKLWLRFALYAALVASAGYAVARSGVTLVNRTGLSETVVGTLFTAVATSLPELVTAVAAVRQGALTLAVGDIIGGNTFDVLFLAFADMAFREGSIYHTMGAHQILIIALGQVLTGVLLLGLLGREKRGIGNIGFESVLVLVLYVSTVSFLFASG